MNIETIEQLVEVLHKSPLARLDVEGDDWSLQLERAALRPAAPIRPESPRVSVPDEPVVRPDLTKVEAPMVGVFHETRKALVQGQTVRAGEVLGSIESLALRNDIRSPVDGEVVELQVEDGQPVEYGQPLFTLARIGEMP